MATRADNMRASEIRELLKLIDRPGMLSFAGGIPDPGLFDLAHYGTAYRDALSAGPQPAHSLQYSISEGYLPLREWIASRMAAKGVPCGPDNILVTNGSQQGLDLIGKLMIDQRDAVVTRYPTYLGAIQAFSAYEPEFVPLKGSDQGLVRDAKLIYVVPDFANPSGETLDRTSREWILTRAEKIDAFVVEDAAYTDLRYEGAALSPIAALDFARCGSIEKMRTLYCGTFSKTLSPGLRVGWICGPADLIRRLTLAKQSADLHTSTINQIVAHRVAVDSFDAQVAKARGVYRSRRDAMLTALERHAPAEMSWVRPEGGLFVWVTLAAPIDTADFLKVAIDYNLAFVPGRAFFPDGTGDSTMRLSFSLCDERSIEEGVARLCGLVSQHLPRAA